MAVLFRHELLAKVRMELGLTQEDAARSVGVDVRTYRRYESGEVNEGGEFAVQRASRRRILDRICRELGIGEKELLKPIEKHAVPSTGLPRARHFVGRDQQLSHVQRWLGDPGSGSRILAVVGIGGAGKTSLVEQAIARHTGSLPLFVHSFYEEPSTDTFLTGAAAYFERAGADPLDGTLAGLQHSPQAVVVLDGLELVQATGENDRARGELEDRRLVRLLRGVTRGKTSGRLLVTSRFRLSDVASCEGVELETLELPPLDANEMRALFERWGIRGSSTTLSSVHEQTGGHALSLAVIGSYAAEVLNGDLELAADLNLADAARDQPLARKLHRVLEKYAAELQPLERRLLVCTCLFPRGLTEQALTRLPELKGSTTGTLRAALGRLVHRGLVAQLGTRYSAHPFIREHFGGQSDDAVAIHRQQRELLIAELEGQPRYNVRGAPLLEAYEQLFEHTLLAGDLVGAYLVTARSLGGFAHLGLRLGEFERGLRLMRALEPLAGGLPYDMQRQIGYERGLYAGALGDLEEAVRAYRTLLVRDDDDSTTHRTLAYTLRLRGDLAGAHLHVERSIGLGRRGHAIGTVVRGLALKGAIFTSERRLVEAGAAFAEARALGDSPTARRSIWEAEYLLAKGEAERAVAETAQNIAECQQRGWAGHVAHCHVILGRAALARNVVEDAEDSLRAALDWCLRSGEVELTLEAKLLELAIASRLDDTPRATQARSELVDAAVAGGFGLIRAQLAGAG